MVSDYIVKIGTATENEVKFALSHFLHKRFTEEGTFDRLPCPDGKDAEILGVVSVVCALFGEIILDRSPSGLFRQSGEMAYAQESIPEETVRFASDNTLKIEKAARSLSSDHKLCSILSGAAYNTGYGRYVYTGGSRGFFSNLFITYIRTLYEPNCDDLCFKTYSKICDLSPSILAPMNAMMHFGILTRFPHNPNERDYYAAVHEFAFSMGGCFG
jgi:hypothetical protein